MVMKRINKSISKDKLKSLVTLVLGMFLLSGCATGFMTSYSSDPKTGQSIKTVYSPLFSSDSSLLANGAEFRVSVVITRRVEPISYSLLSAVGGLTPDDMESKATAVVHFKNDSQQTYKIALKEINILNQGFFVRIPEIILKPGDRFDTKQILVKAPTYDTDFTLGLQYEIDGKTLSRTFSMRRETMEDLEQQRR